MMKCPYCGSEMEEGALVSRVVPLWIKKGEKKGTLLDCKKSFTQNELLAHSCTKCKKIILDIKETSDCERCHTLRKRVLKIILGVLLLWSAIFTVDWVTVSCFDHSPIFCVKNDGGHFCGLGYSYDVYPHPISGEFQYWLYVFGVSTISTFTD